MYSRGSDPIPVGVAGDWHTTKERACHLMLPQTPYLDEGFIGIIAKGKKPIIKLTVISDEPSDKASRLIGKYDNTIEIPEDFDSPLEDLKEYT